MNIKSFFKYLSYGNLSQYAVGTGDAGEVAEKDYPKLITAINLGLTALHTQLPIKREQVIIETVEAQKTYILDSKYARSNTESIIPEDKRYILDTGAEFTNNVLMIENVIKETGVSYPLNVYGDNTSVFTPLFNRVQFSKPENTLVAVIYRANHKLFPVSKTIDLNEEIEIPDYCLELLLLYVTAHVLGSGGNAEAIQEGLMLNQRFEANVARATTSGLMPSEIYHKDMSLESLGWV